MHKANAKKDHFEENKQPKEAKIIKLNQGANVASMEYLFLSFEKISDLINQNFNNHEKPNE